MLVEIYTDGSGTVGNLPGGWAFVVVVEGVKVGEGSGHLPKATNNVAEITAAISGLEFVLTHDLPGVNAAPGDEVQRFVLVSDSQLVLHFADGTWRCKQPHLLPLYLKVRKLYKQLGAETRWVRGHTGDEGNERCDELAKAARLTQPQNPSNQDGTIIHPVPGTTGFKKH